MRKRRKKRIPLEKFMDLKVDYAFKQLFGKEQNKDITIAFLNAVLEKTSHSQIQDLQFVSQGVGGEFQNDKESQLDIVAKTSHGDMINVEIQLNNQYDMLKRTQYYWSRLFGAQLQKGKVYRGLPSVIVINICDFMLFPEKRCYHSSYHLTDDDTGLRLPQWADIQEYHFLEVPKFVKKFLADYGHVSSTALEEWLMLLGMVNVQSKKNYKEIYCRLEELAMENAEVDKALEAWERLSMSPEESMKYFSRMKYVLDEACLKADQKFLTQEKERLGKELERIQEETFKVQEEAQKLQDENLKLQEALKAARRESLEQSVISLLDVLDDQTIASKLHLPLEQVRKLRAKHS